MGALREQRRRRHGIAVAPADGAVTNESWHACSLLPPEAAPSPPHTCLHHIPLVPRLSPSPARERRSPPPAPNDLFKSHRPSSPGCISLVGCPEPPSDRLTLVIPHPPRVGLSGVDLPQSQISSPELSSSLSSASNSRRMSSWISSTSANGWPSSPAASPPASASAQDPTTSTTPPPAVAGASAASAHPAMTPARIPSAPSRRATSGCAPAWPSITPAASAAAPSAHDPPWTTPAALPPIPARPSTPLPDASRDASRPSRDASLPSWNASRPGAASARAASMPRCHSNWITTETAGGRRAVQIQWGGCRRPGRTAAGRVWSARARGCRAPPRARQRWPLEWYTDTGGAGAGAARRVRPALRTPARPDPSRCAPSAGRPRRAAHARRGRRRMRLQPAGLSPPAHRVPPTARPSAVGASRTPGCPPPPHTAAGHATGCRSYAQPQPPPRSPLCPGRAPVHGAQVHPSPPSPAIPTASTAHPGDHRCRPRALPCRHHRTSGQGGRPVSAAAW
eukprot:scaffold13708_cov116-Isochrysis_galbana.AAC.4